MEGGGRSLGSNFAKFLMPSYTCKGICRVGIQDVKAKSSGRGNERIIKMEVVGDYHLPRQETP